jgi:hydroxyethylthiazole kinase-like uncharacterized protein yjeF
MDQWKIWSANDARQHVYIPESDDDKYSHGVLGIIAGSDEYPGSAVLTCSATLRTGIGMVRYFGSEKSQMLVLTSCPEVVTQPGKVSAWSIGSGVDLAQLDVARESQIESALTSLTQSTPVLLDAGALPLVGRFHGPTLITPHFRELARLMTHLGSEVSAEDIESNPREWSVRASHELDVCVLLKGSTTFIASEDSLIEIPSSTSWLATAGTGDVLAGIIGALLATQSEKISKNPHALSEIAATGVFIHSAAALSASRGGPISASDLLPEIAPVIRGLISPS